jgi:hypothetical protein
MTTKIGLWIAIVFAVCAGLFLTFKALTLKPKVVEIKSILNPITGETTKLNTYEDNEGVQHTTFKLDESNTVTIKDLKDPNRPRIYADTVAKALNIALSRIISLERIIISYRADSLQGIKAANQKKVSYKDKYATISYTPAEDTSKAGFFDFKYDSQLTLASYNKREKILGLSIGKKINYTDISSEDTRATVNGFKSLQIKKPVPFFGLRGQGIANYDIGTQAVGTGAGIIIDLGKLSLQGSYMYYPMENEIRPNVRASWDFVRF